MTKDALLTSHPVSAEISNPDDIMLYFDAISYDKVTTAMRQIHHFAMHFSHVGRMEILEVLFWEAFPGFQVIPWATEKKTRSLDKK